jgi:hypothetical protein
MKGTLRSRYFFPTTIALMLALSIATLFAIHEHKALRAAGDTEKTLDVMVYKMQKEVQDCVCDDIDGTNCYFIMREYYSKGLLAAKEKRAELIRSN